MQVYLAPNTLKNQTKILFKNWPIGRLKSLEARKILCSLYGYKNPHHYNQLTQNPNFQAPTISQVWLDQLLPSLTQQLAFLGNLTDSQAYHLLHLLWPKYIPEKAQVREHQCSFWIYGPLNDFLRPQSRNQEFIYEFNGSPSIKDAIEAIGIPHPEVELLFANQISVGFQYHIQPGDLIDVYPPFHGLKVEKNQKLPVFPEERPKFILDVHLGSLARYLRMAGFDSLYNNQDWGDETIAKMAEEEGRIALTRDLGLLKRSNVQYGHWMRNTDPKAQFQELVDYYQLESQFQAFRLCTECNHEIHPVPKEKIIDRLQEKTREYYDEFHLCTGCDKIYWKGSHYKGMKKFLDQK